MSTGFEGFNDDRPGSGAKLPRRQLVQGMSRIKDMPDARKGYFVAPDEKREIGKTMDVVVLKVDSARVLFYDKKTETPPAGYKGPKCASDDGLVPSSRIKNPVSSVCSGCAYEKKDLVYRVFCYDVKDSKAEGEPVVFVIEAKSTQLATVRAYVKAVREKNKAARDFKVTLTSTMKENDKGQWYVFTFDNIEPTPSNIKAEVDKVYEELTGDGSGEEEPPPPGDEDVPF